MGYREKGSGLVSCGLLLATHLTAREATDGSGALGKRAGVDRLRIEDGRGRKYLAPVGNGRCRAR